MAVLNALYFGFDDDRWGRKRRVFQQGVDHAVAILHSRLHFRFGGHGLHHGGFERVEVGEAIRQALCELIVELRSTLSLTAVTVTLKDASLPAREASEKSSGTSRENSVGWSISRSTSLLRIPALGSDRPRPCRKTYPHHSSGSRRPCRCSWLLRPYRQTGAAFRTSPRSPALPD